MVIWAAIVGSCGTRYRPSTPHHHPTPSTTTRRHQPPSPFHHAVSSTQDKPLHNVLGQEAPAFWIPLDDVDAENGSLQVARGWHQRGVLPLAYVDESSGQQTGKMVDMRKTFRGLRPGQDESKSPVFSTQIDHDVLPRAATQSDSRHPLFPPS